MRRSLVKFLVGFVPVLACGEPIAIIDGAHPVCELTRLLETTTISQGVAGFAAVPQGHGACDPLPAAVLDLVPVPDIDLEPDALEDLWTGMTTGAVPLSRIVISWERPTYQRALPEGPHAIFWNPGNHVEVIAFRVLPNEVFAIYLAGAPRGLDHRFPLTIDGAHVHRNYRLYLIDDGKARPL